jgi:hypothetical protein
VWGGRDQAWILTGAAADGPEGQFEIREPKIGQLLGEVRKSIRAIKCGTYMKVHIL